MSTLANWHSWLFLLDDMNDESSLGRLPDVFEHELGLLYDAAFNGNVEAGGTPSARCLEDIWSTVSGPMSLFWRRRFIRHMANYFAACVWQAAHRSLEQIPDLATFPQMRRDAGAIWPSFDLIEWVAGQALPPSLYLNACYQTMLNAAADVVCWTNDLLTLDKELAHGDTQNLIIVIRHAHGGDWQHAIDEVVRSSDQRVTDFLAAEQALPGVLQQTGCSVEHQQLVSSCTAMLRAWMRGHVDWGTYTNRYWQGGRIWAEAI